MTMGYTGLTTVQLLVLLIVWNLPSLAGFLESMSSKADIEPVDSLVFIGETLRMKCVLSVTDVESTKMYFTIEPGDITIPPENTTVVDNRTISVEVEITEAFTSRNTSQNPLTFSCYAELHLLRTTYVYVERPVRNITNFNGVALFDSSIIVSWDLGQDYLGDIITVDTHWSPGSPPNVGNDCSKTTKESCTIENYSSQDIIFFQVVVSATKKRPSEEYLTPLFEANATSIHRFVVSDHRKTSSPLGFRVVSTNSTSMNLTWNDPLYFSLCFPPCNPLYIVNVTEKSPSLEVFSTEQRSYRYTGEKDTRDEIQICDLTPFTVYEVTVQVKAKDVNPWSDPVFAVGKTSEDRPLEGPPVTETSFSIGDCKGNKRHLFLYWNDPPAKILQGELSGYKVVMHNRTETLRLGSNHFQGDLDCESAYDISVYAATNVGVSQTPSVMHIPRQNDTISVLNDMDFLVQEKLPSEGKLNVFFRWDPSLAVEENVTIIIYKCQEAYIDYTCLDNFDTQEIRADTGNFSLEDLAVKDYLYGYALMGNGKHKRGIQWTDCVYADDRKPEKPRGVSVTLGKDDNSLHISWIASQCNRDKKILVLFYHIFVCPDVVPLNLNATILKQSCIYEIVRSTRGVDEITHIATSLLASEKHHVYIQSESPAGLGPLSDPAIFIPDSSRSGQDGKFIGIAVGVVLPFTIIVCVISYIVWKCRRSWRHSKSLISDLHIFDGSNPCPSNSSESGFCSSSSQNSFSQGTLGRSPPVPLRPDGGSIAVLETHLLSGTIVAAREVQTTDEHVMAEDEIQLATRATNVKDYQSHSMAARKDREMGNSYIKFALASMNKNEGDGGETVDDLGNDIEDSQNPSMFTTEYLQNTTNGVQTITCVFDKAGERRANNNGDKRKVSKPVADEMQSSYLNEVMEMSGNHQPHPQPLTLVSAPTSPNSVLDVFRVSPVPNEITGTDSATKACINNLPSTGSNHTTAYQYENPGPCPSPAGSVAFTDMSESHIQGRKENSSLGSSAVPDYVTCSYDEKVRLKTHAQLDDSHTIQPSYHRLDLNQASANLQHNQDTFSHQNSFADGYKSQVFIKDNQSVSYIIPDMNQHQTSGNNNLEFVTHRGVEMSDIESPHGNGEQRAIRAGSLEAARATHDDYIRQAPNYDPQSVQLANKAIRETAETIGIYLDLCGNAPVKQQQESLDTVGLDTLSLLPSLFTVSIGNNGNSCAEDGKPDNGYLTLDAVLRDRFSGNICLPRKNGVASEHNNVGRDLNMNTLSSVSGSIQCNNSSLRSSVSDSSYQSAHVDLRQEVLKNNPNQTAEVDRGHDEIRQDTQAMSNEQNPDNSDAQLEIKTEHKKIPNETHEAVGLGDSLQNVDASPEITDYVDVDMAQGHKVVCQITVCQDSGGSHGDMAERNIDGYQSLHFIKEQAIPTISGNRNSDRSQILCTISCRGLRGEKQLDVTEDHDYKDIYTMESVQTYI